MTHDANLAASDLASIREIAEEGRLRPLQSGPYLVMWGLIASFSLWLTYETLTGSIPIAPNQTWMIWLPLFSLGGIASAMIGKRQAQADAVTLSAKVERVTWTTGGGFIGLVAFGLYFVIAVRGEPLRAAGIEPTILFGMISPMAFGIYAIALAASAVAGRASWLWGFVSVSFLFAAATLFLVGDGNQFIVTIVGIVVTTIIPGAIMMWRNRGAYKSRMAKKPASPEADNEFDYREIDDLIHGRVRLTLIAYLSGAGTADFTEMRKKLAVTDGNLSIHIRKLEEAGYIEVEKRFRERRPQTLCHLTEKGRKAWLIYIERMENLLNPKAAE